MFDPPTHGVLTVDIGVQEMERVIQGRENLGETRFIPGPWQEGGCVGLEYAIKFTLIYVPNALNSDPTLLSKIADHKTLHSAR